MVSNWSYSLEMLYLGQNHQCFGPCDLDIWRMTTQNSRVPLLCHFKLCALVCSHVRIQTGVTVQKHSIWVKIVNLSARVTLTFDGWPQKTIGHLFYATSSFVHHIVATRIRIGVEVWKCPNLDKICFDLLDLDLWPMPMDITFVNCNNSWKLHDDMMRGTL